MGNLQKISPQGSALTISDRQRDILRIIADVNMLQGYPIPFEELRVWGSDIERLSKATSEELRFLFDCFKTNKIVWDRTIGIQNIFLGLDRLWNDNGEIKIRKDVW